MIRRDPKISTLQTHSAKASQDVPAKQTEAAEHDAHLVLSSAGTCECSFAHIYHYQWVLIIVDRSARHGFAIRADPWISTVSLLLSLPTTLTAIFKQHSAKEKTKQTERRSLSPVSLTLSKAWGHTVEYDFFFMTWRSEREATGRA